MENKIKYKIDSDISKARTLHSDYYTDDIMFSNTINSIFIWIEDFSRCFISILVDFHTKIAL